VCKRKEIRVWFIGCILMGNAVHVHQMIEIAILKPKIWIEEDFESRIFMKKK